MFDSRTESDGVYDVQSVSVTFARGEDPTPAGQVSCDSRARCTSCMMRNICMAASLEAGEMARLDTVVQGWRSVKQGERLYRAGDPFRSLYAIRAGSFKTVVSPERGKETISGFYMAGDSIGMDGVCQESHNCDAIALEDSVVCVIPFHLLEALCREIKPLQRQLHKMFSAEIVRESRQMTLLSNMSAEQRVAAFLLNVSARYRERGYSATSFVLRMTREDIGSFLGVTLETVSRTLSKFQQEGLLTVQGKSIELINLDALDAR
ncbi:MULTISPECIES: fumarate/nitrate reduction transcriptional regulator Fnr [unclassified Cupriavidus]|uniref:fumarate/nitrate reduction transcriptional regulator Fnr n=1 Tax=unclassified Cupriavidus TaxID=2640874 RepID=UPI00048E51B1|nr:MULTISPECIES: fumarate/nitrate reduction transcriptional regulator Fnr [unclassified Cupriavidus]MBP0630766.1 fumarate/nitrate reduction transcriptional regulator Fnr [Cupriavidus sp. AcVe19-1a]MBP0637428.1 fumarate/nitrate reduction transcriptional regulator Fnr [Cupriavidus sp. AcVe19-6a]